MAQQGTGQDDPVASYLRKYGRAAARTPAAADPVASYLAKYAPAAPADTVPSPSIVPNDTTTGPEGIRADDTGAVQRYLRQSDSLSRRAEARRDSLAAAPKPAPTPRPQRTPVAGRGISMTPEQERAGQEHQQGFAEGAKNVALGVPRFLGSTVKGALSYTPEELRREDIRDYVRSQGKDPDQLLHEALRQRGRGENLGPIETGRATAIGMGRMGYDLQREAQGGAIWELGADRQGHLIDESPDMSTGERIRRVTELAGNAALFGAGAEEGSLDTRLNAGHQAIVDAAGRVKARLGGGRRPATPPSAITSAADAVPLPGVEAAQAAPPRTPRAEYEAQAGPVRTAPGAEELLRQPSADPFVEEAYAQQAKPRDIATMSADEAANEAAQLSLIAKKTPEQRARAEALNERARQESEKLAPPPPVEQSAFRGEEPPPITRDIVERERQRPELEASGRIPQPPQRAPYEERRAPGDRRYDETGLIDETEERRQAERRQPGTSRTRPERRDLGSRPVPQGEERREGITSPAIRLPSGEVVTGANHSDAIERAAREGKLPPEYENIGNDAELPDVGERGYATTHREFVPEREAVGIAKAAGQVGPHYQGLEDNPLVSEDVQNMKDMQRYGLQPGGTHDSALPRGYDPEPPTQGAPRVDPGLLTDLKRAEDELRAARAAGNREAIGHAEAKVIMLQDRIEPTKVGINRPLLPEEPSELPPLPELAGPAIPGPRPPKVRTPELPARPDELAAHEAARPAPNAEERFARALDPIGGPLDAIERVSQQPPQPTTPIDLSALDARVEAQRAKNAKLQADQEAMPVKRLNPAERIAERRRNRELAEGTHTTLLRERAVMERQLQQVKDELASYPQKGRPRPALAERLKALKATISDYQTRIKELNNQIGERGFVINPFGGNKLAQPNARQAALLPPEVRAVLDHVAVGEKAPFRLNLNDTLQQWFWETSRPARSLERAAMKAGHKLPLDQRPLLAMKAALDSPTRIGGWLLSEGAGPGRWDSQGNWQLTGTPSFETALEPIRGDPVQVSLWRARLVAEHAPEIEAAGFDTGIPKAEAAAVAAMQLPPEVARAVKYSHDLLNDALQYGVDAGAYTPGLQQILRTKYQQYVPFQRAFEGEGSSRTGTGGPTNLRGPVRKLKGSERPVVDPAETIPDYVARMVRYADIYRAARSTINLIEAHPDLFEGMAKKVGSAPLKSVGQATQALGQLLSDKALSLEGDRITLANSATGTLDTYQVDPIIGDMLRGLGSKEYGLANELIFGVFKKGVTFGVTNNPVFGVIVNPIRDALGRPTMSTATTYPGQGSASAAWNVISESPKFKKFRSMGGGFGLSAESGGGMAQLARSIGGRGERVGAQLASQARAEKFVGKRSTIRLGLPIDILKAVSLPAEQMGRFAEFRTVKAKGRSVYGDETMSDLEAHMHTQEALGNFAEHGTGAAIRLLAHDTPFLNPALQGTRAFLGAARRNPGRFVAAGIATITLPTVALYYVNRNDKEIRDQRQSAGGYLYWYARAPNNDIIKVPKPFGAGAIFGTAVEHALDAYFEHDLDAATRGFDDFWKEMAPNFIPPAAGLAYSLGTNKDLYSGTPIVPNEQQGNLPEYQIGRHPSPTMNRVGQALGTSPAKLKFATRQLGGTGAGELLNLLDRTTHGDELPAMRKPDLPFVGRLFARTPTSAAAPIRDVYNESNGPASVLTTLQYLARKGQTAELQRFVQEHKEELPRAGVAQGFVQAMSQLADKAELLEGLQQLSPEQRAEKRDEILRVMTTLADRFHPILHRLAAEEDLAKRNRPR